MLKDKTIIVGVTGCIAAYKACEVVSRLKHLGAQVWVVMTEAATKFVEPLTFRTLSGNPVITTLFSPDLKDLPVPHISLTDTADLILVVPATADMIGKVAGGIADDPLSTMLLASNSPQVFAPAMNTRMWNNTIVQENVRKLKEKGAIFIGPSEGSLACGVWGAGKLASPEEIVSRVIEILVPKLDLKNLKVMVTAGGTREPIDPVRYIGNRSSGKMGFALAEAALSRGAKVTLISGPVHLAPPAGVEFVSVETADQMHAEVLARFKYTEVLVMAAAVADYSSKLKTQSSKLKKGEKGIKLELEPTVDILAGLKRLKRKQFVIGFALETEALVENAREKLKQKGLDLIVANDPSTFDADSIQFTLINKKGEVSSHLAQPKKQAAHLILDCIKTCTQK